MQNDMNKERNALFSEKRVPIAIAIYIIAASAYIPSGLLGASDPLFSYILQVMAIALCVIGFILSARIAGAVRPIIPLIVVTVIVFIVFGAPNFSAAVPLFFIASALSAYFCRKRHAAWLILIGAVTFCVSFFLSGGLISALIALIPLLAGLTLHLSHLSVAQRVGSICRVSTVTGLATVAIFCGGFFVATGSLSLDAIRVAVEEFQSLTTDIVAENMFLAYNIVSEVAISTADALAIASEAVSSVFNYLPAIFVITLFVLAYLSHSLYLALLAPTASRREIGEAAVFRMSIFSAAVYILALAVSLFLTEDKHGFWLVALDNLCVIFYPGLTLSAFEFLGIFARGKNASCLGYISYMLVFILMFNFPSVALPIVSFAGAVIVIYVSIMEMIQRRG